VQEASDMACIAQAASLESRVPFLHFFDGFRTSHEVNMIEPLSDDDLRAMIDDKFVRQHRERALTPDRPVLRGTAQNPDVFFQAREASNPYYRACPTIVQDVMDRFAKRTRRLYHLFDYYGEADAERVIILMGSAAGAAEEAVDALRRSGEKVGLLKVRLFRPFAADAFLKAIPASAKAIAVLDRTKEPGALGEPLYQDALTAYAERYSVNPDAGIPRVIGGRYGLSSKEFTPAMVKAVFDELKKNRTEESLHRRHRGRRHSQQPYPRRSLLDGRSADRSGAFLWLGFRWNRRGKQELHQNHREGNDQLRPGLLRV